MATITPIQTSISALELRSRLGEIIDKAIYQGRIFIVKRAGKAAVAILPMAQYEQLMATTSREVDTSVLVAHLQSQYPTMTNEELTVLVTEALHDIDAERDTPAVETLALMLNAEVWETIQQSQEEIKRGSKISLDVALV
jgi:prevent-host-death family protein